MKKITKEQNLQRDSFVTELQQMMNELATLHDEVFQAAEKYNEQIGKINAKIEEVEEFVGNITSDMQAYLDEKSERWLEGDAGGEYTEWKDTWDSLAFEQLEVLELADVPDLVLIQELDDLPVEPG